MRDLRRGTCTGETDAPATDTRVGKVVRDDLVGVTAADAAAIAAEADIVVEFPFSGVPGRDLLAAGDDGSLSNELEERCLPFRSTFPAPVCPVADTDCEVGVNIWGALVGG